LSLLRTSTPTYTLSLHDALPISGATANYTITVSFNGNNTSCTSPLSITGGLPAGVSVADTTFTPSSVTSTGANQTASLAIATHRSEEHTSELQSHLNLVCRLLLE